MSLVAAILLGFASSFLLLRLGGSIKGQPVASAIFECSLAAGVGIGIWSVVYFIARIAGIHHLLLADVAVFLALVIAYVLFRPRPAVAFNLAAAVPGMPQWLERMLAIAFLPALAAALYSVVVRTLAYPHGDGWDAFSIWNLRARFLFLGGEQWRDTFSPQIPWSHPDYPLLIPASAAHFWTLLGRDDVRVPAAITVVFTFATIGLLFSTLHMLRGRTAAMLGSLTLVATPAFIEQGTAQYADVPLSFFFLAVIALLCLSDESSAKHGNFVALAGLAAAFSAWTKNEGLLFLAAIFAAQVLVTILYRDKLPGAQSGTSWRSCVYFFAGALPVLLVLFYFKHTVAGPGDLFANGASALHKLLEPTRYWVVLQWFVKDFFRFGRWLLIPGTLLLAGFYFTLKSAAPERSSAMRSCAIALLLTLAGYAAIYVITPRDLYWHLRFSSDRLFLQLWPSAIFLFFLGWQR